MRTVYANDSSRAVLPPSLKATLEEMARKERRSLASLVQIILEDYVAAKKAESGKPAKRK